MEVSEWSAKTFKFVIHYQTRCMEAKGTLGFHVLGGSDRGEFLRVGPKTEFGREGAIYYDYGSPEKEQKQSNGASGRHRKIRLREGDVILETDDWNAVGLRTRDYLGLTELRRRTPGPLTIKCVHAGWLPLRLRDFLEVKYQVGTPLFELQNATRQTLLKYLPPVTTRFPRPGEVDGREYSFYTLDTFLRMEKIGHFLQVRELDGHFYGIRKPDYNAREGLREEMVQFKALSPVVRNNSFVSAFGMADTSSSFDETESSLGTSPAENDVEIHRRKTAKNHSVFIV